MTTTATQKPAVEPRNSFTISVTQELFSKGAPHYETELEAKRTLAAALRTIPNVQKVERNTTDPDKFICDVTIGTDALSLVTEAKAIMEKVYAETAKWAKIVTVQQSANSRPTVRG